MKAANDCGSEAKLPGTDVGNAGEAEATHGARMSLRGRIRALLGAGEEGSQLVEFAMVAPVFLVLLTGMASFAMALYSYQELGYAVSGAVQSVAAQQGLVGDACAAIVTDVDATLPNWSSSNFKYTLQVYETSSTSVTAGPTTGTGFSCTADTADMTANEPITLTVSYPYSWFPIMGWARTGNTFAASGNLSVTQSAMAQ
jgi:Flp pilus assembly protein TadG